MASIRLLTYTVTSDGNKWGIAGVWAHGGFRAVAVSDGTLKSSTYIGLWSDDNARILAHFRIPALT